MAAVVASPLSAPLPAPLNRGCCWPSAEQELLLQAAVMPPAQALGAWREWSRRVDLLMDRIDSGSLRLLPKVYRNLRDCIRDDANAGKLEGLHKRHWYENQLAFAAGAELLQALHAEGIDTFLLKGAPLALRYYGDIGARPMSDLDVLVPAGSALAAARTLARLGWRPENHTEVTAGLLRHRHAHGFRRERGAALDLHWHVLSLCHEEAVSRRFREAAVPLEIRGVATRTLCSADQLVCVCMHGLRWNEVPPLRWVVDAMVVLGSREHPVDWERVLEMSAACRGNLQLHAALSYLRERFAAPVPEAVLGALARAPASPLERKLYDALTRGGNWRGARVLWLCYRAKVASGGQVWRLGGFLEHLRVLNGHATRWQTLRWVASRALARLGRQAWPGRGASGDA